jgi:hypothetical protein
MRPGPVPHRQIPDPALVAGHERPLRRVRVLWSRPRWFGSGIEIGG